MHPSVATPTLFFLFSFVIGATADVCGYEEPSEDSMSEAILLPKRGRPVAKSLFFEEEDETIIPIDWTSLKIDVAYHESIRTIESAKRDQLKDMITRVRQSFEALLSVEDDDHRIFVGGHCEDEQCVVSCGSHQFGNTRDTLWAKCDNCSSGTGDDHGVNGNYALVVGIGSCGNGGTIAKAAHCANHWKTGRPLLGYVKICQEAFNNRDPAGKDDAKWTGVLMHEITHALVFSTGLFEKFILPNQNNTGEKRELIATDKFDNVTLTVPGVTQQVVRQWKTAGGYVDHPVVMVTTPKVREAAIALFDCYSLAGAELENQGGPGTQGVHWEKRIFEEEAMSGVATQKYVFSTVTMALFEDSGWYQVNYTEYRENFYQPMPYSERRGCDFAEMSCYEYMKTRADPEPYCNVLHKKKCSLDRRYRTMCNLHKQGDRPKEDDYNYRDDSLFPDKTYVGILNESDYCPYMSGFRDLSMRSTLCSSGEGRVQKTENLELFSDTARCYDLVDGSVNIRKNLVNITTKKQSSVCFETKCDNGFVHVKPRNSPWYPCYRANQTINIDRELEDGRKVDFQIICPPCESICINVANFTCDPNGPLRIVGDFAIALPSYFAIVVALLAVIVIT